MVEICTELDSFVRDRQNPPRVQPYWRATLSDGDRTFYSYQDDGRFGPEDVAWRRLSKYCEENNCEVVDLWVIFRDHAEQVKAVEPEGFYFRQGVGADPNQGETERFYVLGVLEFGRVLCYWYKVPELVVKMEDEKSIEEAGEGLIRGRSRIGQQ